MKRGIKMSVTPISENVYSVGVMNPSLRVFDIVMESKYGTSYNAYLINDTKTALVETVHNDYFDEYLYNIGQLADIGEIDYLIMNHTELDHSGCVLKLLELNPKITVVCTAAAKKYLTAITNREINCITVKNGDEIDLGNGKLKFIVAPLLHWPDSMMTYYDKEQLLFSCDFLGAHFCEPQVTDDCIKYKDEYLEQFHYYFNGIFGPFKPYVLAGLDKLEGLSFSAICPSHGPVLVEGIKERMEEYRMWSTPAPKSEGKTAVVLYASAYGCTKKLALAAKEQLEADGISVKLFDMVKTKVSDCAQAIMASDAVMVGSTTINRDAPKIVWDVLASLDAINIKKKPAAVFGSFGWSGEASGMMYDRMKGISFNMVSEPVKANFMPTEEDEKAVKLAAQAVSGAIK